MNSVSYAPQNSMVFKECTCHTTESVSATGRAWVKFVGYIKVIGSKSRLQRGKSVCPFQALNFVSCSLMIYLRFKGDLIVTYFLVTLSDAKTNTSGIC